MQWWNVPPEWEGQQAFILAGGASVSGQNTELLSGRNVIAINSSWTRVPFAQVLYFSDANWWDFYGEEAARAFRGRIVTAQPENNVQVHHPRIHYLKRSPIAGLPSERDTLTMRSTSLYAAICLAVLLGAHSIVLLGVDGKRSEDGRTHHHAGYPWDLRTGVFAAMHEDLATLVEPLRDRGIDCVNASPNSAWADLWPLVDLKDYL